MIAESWGHMIANCDLPSQLLKSKVNGKRERKVSNCYRYVSLNGYGDLLNDWDIKVINSRVAT